MENNQMEYWLIAVAVMAIVTYLIRMIPLTFLRKKIQNRFVRSFLYYVPYAVLAAMTFPDIFHATSNIFSALVGMVVAIGLAYKNQGLLVVALGAVVAVFIVEQGMMFLF